MRKNTRKMHCRDSHRWKKGIACPLMTVWGFQMVLLWSRALLIVEQSGSLGDFVQMVLSMFRDILLFAVMLGTIFVGFVLGLKYIVGGDMDYDTVELDAKDEISSHLNSFKGVILYLMQALLGQQDWEIWRENKTHNFSRIRAQLGLLYVLAFIIIGTIILMNLLIALMTTSFERVQNDSAKLAAYHRAESAYDLSSRGRFMPPPLNM